MNLASFLARTAGDRGERTALRLGQARISYQTLDETSSRVAGLLGELDVGPSGRVGVMLGNTPDFAAVYYGVLRAGGVVVPMNPLLKAREVAFYLSDSGATVLFAAQAFAAEARAGAAQAGADVVEVGPTFLADLAAGPTAQPIVATVADRDGSDTAVILYTSGTTGRPKGAELTHANLTRNAEVTATTLLKLTPDDVIFGGLPLFHSFGQTVTLNTAVMSGASVTMLPRFDPAAALSTMADHEVTVFAGVPTMYTALVAAFAGSGFDASRLRVCVSGGAALPVEVLHEFEKAYGCPILEGYGLSETSPVASFNHPDTVRKPGSIGTPIAGVQMRVIDVDGRDVPPGEVGEIAIAGHNIMKGYWRRPDATAAAIVDGWFRTGDLGRVDEDGYYFIVDRKKDLIIRGGYNVYPREVEEVLYEHPAVAEAAVIGVPHPSLGEEVNAVVALKSGATDTPEDIREFVKQQVAAYKYPRNVYVVDALPKGPTGKILKREIVVPAEARLS
jgi:long-chain acyl-CoA synthetase